MTVFVASPTAYAYDTYGRRVSETTGRDVTTYTWDAMGHLVEIASTEATSTYSYGVTGMREYARVETSAGVTWTKSVWAGQRLVCELDSDGVRYDYLYAPDGTPVAVKVTGGTAPGLYCYHTDATGSVVALSKAAIGGGPVVATYAYGPFGEQTGQSGTDPLASRNPLRYRGYYADGASGLYYLPARYYDPATARFLSKDPAPPQAGDPRSLNAYAYCMGDPVNHHDPSGAYMDAHGGGGGEPWDPVALGYAFEGDVETAAALQRVKHGQWLFNQALYRGLEPLEEWDPVRYREWSAGAQVHGVAMDLNVLGWHVSVQLGVASNYNNLSGLVSFAAGADMAPGASASISLFHARYNSKDSSSMFGRSAAFGASGSMGTVGPAYGQSVILSVEDGPRVVGQQQEYGWAVSAGSPIAVNADVCFTLVGGLDSW